MISINKKETPLSVLNSLKYLIDTLKKLSKENEELIEFSEKGELLFLAKDKDAHSRFFFEIKSFKQNNDLKTYYTVSYMPYNSDLIKEISRERSDELVIKDYKQWISLVKAHENILIGQQDSFQKKYEEEFYDLFEIVDGDSDEYPFDTKRQFILNDMLSVTYLYLDQQKENIELVDLKNEVLVLQENLHKETKKIVIKRLSKIFAKIKMKGVPLLKGLFTKLKDEAIKRGINWGFNQLGNLLDNIV